MPTTPAKPPPAKQPAETVEPRFRRLGAAWQEAVAYQSSTTVRNSHPAH